MPQTLFGKTLLGIALVAFTALQFSLWLGEGGVGDVRALKAAIAAQQIENEKLAERNRVLEAEVKDLKNGLEAVEEHSRQDLGMIRQNETFYLVTGNPDARQAAQPQAAAR
ncbi:MAG: cell division protein FtsB [Pseudomonadota bacterium]